MFVVSGPSGAGKGTLVARVVASDPSLWLSKSWTTRAKRPGETGDEYRFVDRETFLNEARRGGFLEWVTFDGELYGTPVPDAPPDRDIVLEIDLQGAQLVRAKHPRAVVILVTAPSNEARAERMRARGDDESEVERRLELGKAETARGAEIADHIVVNDDVARAAAELAAIIELHRRTYAGHGRPEGA